MDGKDKGLLTICGHPAAVRPLALLKPLCDYSFISANRNQERYALLGANAVISDLRPGFEGPLAGIEAAQSVLESLHDVQKLLLLPCDLPFLSQEVPRQLLKALETRPELDIVYASTGGRAHYLCAAMRTRILKNPNDALNQGNRAVHRWYRQEASAELRFYGALAEGFVNINRPEDLQLQSRELENTDTKKHRS